MIDELQVVEKHEVAAIATLINQSFSSRIWELDPAIFTGSRISEIGLTEELVAQPNGTLLQWKVNNTRMGCVFLNPLDLEHRRWYMGYLCVDSAQMGTGLGTKMLLMAEHWAQQRGAKEMTLKVVNVRKPLIEWYLRRGYHHTGEDEPFPYDHFSTGTMLFKDLLLVSLRKVIH